MQCPLQRAAYVAEGQSPLLRPLPVRGLPRWTFNHCELAEAKFQG